MYKKFMILFVNVKITNIRIHKLMGWNYRKCDWMPEDDRLNIFKYTLASYNELNSLFSKIYIFASLEDDFKDRKDEFFLFCKELYKDTPEKVFIGGKRIDTIDDWKFIYPQIFKDEDEVVFFVGNDDHIFLDNNLETIQAAEKLLKNDPNPMAFFVYSHFPESSRFMMLDNAVRSDYPNIMKAKHLGKDFSFQMLKVSKLKTTIHDIEYPPNARAFRFDEVNHIIVNSPIGHKYNANGYFPIKEQVRHYDGYGHVGYFNNICPPLKIPVGFLENNIKIKYGYRQRFEGFLNVNPKSPFLYAHDKKGTDYRFYIGPDNDLSDVPMAIRSRISEIDYAPDINFEELKNYRNKYFIKSTRCKIFCKIQGKFIPGVYEDDNVNVIPLENLQHLLL